MGTDLGPRGQPHAKFESIRESCLKNRELYEDPVFPASDKSLYFSRLPPYKIEWLRPREISLKSELKPYLFTEGSGRFDVKQGELGDCWVIAACACMSENTELLYRILPRGQSFLTNWYAGIFHFQFYRYGEWVDVVVDDRLPTFRGRLIFMHSSKSNEFWCALLEKAYAKLHGSYEALKSGLLADCLQDLTGGVVESYRVRGKHENMPSNIVNMMFKALERQSLIGCAIDPIPSTFGEVKLDSGLVAAHCYSITDLREIRLISDQGEIPITLVRVRNPWGTHVEWYGPWSDRSQEWNSISQKDREKMGLTFRDDGEFWMDFKDFVDHFDTLDICNLSPDSPIETPRKWIVSDFSGQWAKGVSAGGRPFLRDTHWSNPQIKLVLKDSDDDEDNKCSVIVELAQKDRRKMKHKGAQNVTIGFIIYKVHDDFKPPFPRAYFDRHGFVARCDSYINRRQIVKRFQLEPGEYVLLPSTYDANIEASFTIRVFFENANSARTIDADLSISDETPPIDLTFKSKEKQIKEFFYDVSGEDMRLNPYEFRSILNTAMREDSMHEDISIEACKSFVSLVDKDRTGKLDYNGFVNVWDSIKMWKKSFLTYARSGMLNSYQLRSTLQGIGFSVSGQILSGLVFKFADEQHQIDLNRFLMCVTLITRLFDIFRAQSQNSGNATFTLSEFFQQGVRI